MDIKRILFPTDFSPNSLNCLTFVREIANRTGAEVQLLHVFHHRVLSPSTPPQKFEEKAKEEQEKARARLSALGHSLENDSELPVNKCFTEMRIGFADDEIIQVSKERNADLIIMGTKGSTGLHKVMLGSVTAEVIEESMCPVLAIPEDAHYSGLSHIVFATDLDKKDFPTLKKVADFARIFDSKLTVLHIKQKEYAEVEEILKSFENELHMQINYEQARFRFLRNAKKVEGIDHFLKENEADLLSMVTHRRKLFQGLFKRSLTRQIAHQAQIPLLAFHDKGD